EGIEPLPAESIPHAVAAQLGYPSSVIGAQARMLGRLARDTTGARVEWPTAWVDSAGHGDASHTAPALAVLDLGGGPRLWSLVPLMDLGGTRLTAIVAGSSDERGIPELKLLVVPPGVPTPAAIGTRLAVLPGAQALQALATGDGQLRRGEVVPLPVAGTIA